MDVKVLITPFEEGDFLVVIVGVDLVLPGECVCWSHVDSSFYSPLDVIFLQE